MREAGFTLIELLVVIAIIGILAAIAIPQYAEYRTSSFNTRARSDLRNILTAQEVRYLDSEVYQECSNAGCNAPALPGFTLSQGNSATCALFDDGQTYQCAVSHENGTRLYYFNSSGGAFWDTSK